MKKIILLFMIISISIFSNEEINDNKEYPEIVKVIPATGDSIDINCKFSESKLSMCIVNGYKVDSATPNEYEMKDIKIMVRAYLNDPNIPGKKEKITKIKLVGYVNLDEYKKDKSLAYKRVVELYKILIDYNLDKSIEIVSLEVREPEKPLEKTVEKRYWNRKVEIIVLE